MRPTIPHDGIINWHESAKDVYNFIRAQSDPYPGAFTSLDGKKITIWKTRRFRGAYAGMPGQVARIANEEVIVICGNDRAIILEEVEMDGSRGKATEFIKSIKARLI